MENTLKALQEQLEEILPSGWAEVIIEKCSCDEIQEILDLQDEEDFIRVGYLIAELDYDCRSALDYYMDVEFYDVLEPRELVYYMLDEGLFGTIDERLIPYLDIDAIWYDLELDGYEYVPRIGIFKP